MVFVVLCLAAAAVGYAGLYSSGQRSLNRQLSNPATRMAATAALADQFADQFAPNAPSLEGARSQQVCPAAWASRASVLLGPLSPTQANTVMTTAAARFRTSAWHATTTAISTGVTLEAVNRRGIAVSVTEQPGQIAASLEITVTVPCVLGPARQGRRQPTTTTLGPGAPGGS